MKSSDESVEQYLQKISYRVWITKNSRWNAVRRLKMQSQMSIFSISLLSICGISVPIIQIFIDSSKCARIDNVYTLVSILLSIFILVLSILEGTKNHQVKAEILKNNALEISSISKEIDFLVNYKFKQSSDDKENQNIVIQVKKYYKDYDKSLRLCSENHEVEDYLLAQAQEYCDQNNKSESEENQTSITHIKNIVKNRWIFVWLRIKYYWLYSG